MVTWVSVCFATSVTSDVSPTLAMSQISPSTKPSVFSGGCSALWHSWADANLCVPRRHSTTRFISLRCLLKSFLFVRGGGALQKIVTQGCALRGRLATCSELWDSPVFKPCTNRLRNSRSILNVINSTYSTPMSHVYALNTASRHKYTIVWGMLRSAQGRAYWSGDLENRDEMGGYRTSPFDLFYDDVSANSKTLLNPLSESCRACWTDCLNHAEPAFNKPVESAEHRRQFWQKYMNLNNKLRGGY